MINQVIDSDGTVKDVVDFLSEYGFVRLNVSNQETAAEIAVEAGTSWRTVFELALGDTPEAYKTVIVYDRDGNKRSMSGQYAADYAVQYGDREMIAIEREEKYRYHLLLLKIDASADMNIVAKEEIEPLMADFVMRAGTQRGHLAELHDIADAEMSVNASSATIYLPEVTTDDRSLMWAVRCLKV